MAQRTVTRLVTLDDAPRIAWLTREHWDYFAPWEPLRDNEFFTESGQRTLIATDLDRHQQDLVEPRVIVDESGQPVGRITLFFINRGPLQSCTLGYWIAPPAAGHGLTSAAVAEIVGYAFGDLGLHRVEAGTLVHNVRSQRVLTKNGFERYGLAPRMLRIAGEWQDHILFQRLNDDWHEPT